MSSVLPHSATIRANVEQYLTDTARHVASEIENLRGSGAYRTIYKITLALDSFLSRLPNSLRPRSSVPRSIIQRVPILIAMGQDAPATVELRRFLECVFWCV
jgi:hypothetical protein